jgi:probable rRNA maturation factor
MLKIHLHRMSNMTTQPRFVQIAEDLPLVDALSVEDLYDLENIALQVFEYLGLDPTSELSIVIANDEFVRELNAQHRKIDKTTDVLSFPADPLPPEIADQEAAYLGDLVIAYPYSLQQAVAHGHRPQDEFALLVVHGLLHLVGYDHDTPESQAEMWEQQAAILQKLKVAIIVPDFVHSEDD